MGYVHYPDFPSFSLSSTAYYEELTNSSVVYCSKEKTHINVVVIGHVDSGKSTTTGKAAIPPYLNIRFTYRNKVISSTSAEVSTVVPLRNSRR